MSDPTSSDESEDVRRSFASYATEALVTGFVAVLAAVLVRTFILQMFVIPSASMEPTLHGCANCPGNDRVVVEKISKYFGEFERGEVVVFRRPGDNEDLIKRVIALPGESVGALNGEVLIDGEPLAEPWPASRTEDFPPVVLKEGEIFVMGDNRGNSGDSRVFGPVELDSVVGRAFIRAWPLSRIGSLGG